MKVLFLTREYPPYSVGGIAKHIFWLSRSLAKLGVKCKVLSFGDPAYSNSDVLFISPESSLSADKVGVKDNLRILQDIGRIDKIALDLFSRGKFDVLHVEDPYLGPFISSCNHVTTVHDTSVGELRFMAKNLRTVLDMKYSVFFATLGPILEQLTIRKSGAIIAVNDHIKDELRRSYGTPRRKIKVIVNGVQLPSSVSKDSAKKELGLSTSELLVFSASRLIPRKRIDLLVEAVKMISESGSGKFCVAICGEGPQKQFLLNLVTEKGLRDKIRILGWVPEEKLHLYYEAADIFVLSSEYEGFPISLLEALAFGAACVSSDISPMILSDGLNGLIFQRGNVAHLVNKLKMLMDDQELRISVSKAGRELAEQYDWDKVAAETKTVYEALLSSSPVDF